MPSTTNAVSLMQGDWISWGPLTLLDKDLYYYKLLPVMKSNVTYLRDILLSWDTYRFFDEWGSYSGFGYKYSFAHVMSMARVKLENMPFHPSIPHDTECCVFDIPHVCSRKSNVSANCGKCLMITRPKATVLLDSNYHHLKLCHFQFTKKVHPNMFSGDKDWEQHVSALVAGKPVSSSFAEGIRRVGIDFLGMRFELDRWRDIKRRIRCFTSE